MEASLENLEQINAEFIQKLAALGVPLDMINAIKPDDDRGYTLLHGAVSSGHIEIVRFLLDHGATLTDIHNRGWWTPLHEASDNGHTEIAKLLLEYGADCNAIARGVTPFHLAIINGRLQVAKILLNQGANY